MEQQHPLVLDADADLQGLCLVLDNTPTSSATLLAIMIRSMLTAGYKVVIGAVAQQEPHYHAVVRKMVAVCIAASTCKTAYQQGISGSTLATHLHVHHISLTNNTAPGEALCTLADALHTAACHGEGANCEGRRPLQRVSLILDDASVLCALSRANTLQWHGFLHACHAGLTATGPYNLTIVADPGVDSDAQWIAALHHRAQTVFAVDPFPEGSSVLGRTALVTVQRRGVLGPVQQGHVTLRCALRATDVVCCLDRLDTS